MRRNEGKYEKVKTLPKKALLVRDYAKENNIAECTVYVQLSRGKANFKIVEYYERNFVVPQ